MTIPTILALSGLALAALPSVQPAIDSASATRTSVQDDGQGETITGRIYDVIHGSDGWTYFLLDNKSMAMKTSDFPDPTPAEGTKMTATGCTEDPSGWGWICTGLS